MFKNKKNSQFSFWRNCLFTYILVGISAGAIADIHQSFHLDNLSNQASNYYRVISID